MSFFTTSTKRFIFGSVAATSIVYFGKKNIFSGRILAQQEDLKSITHHNENESNRFYTKDEVREFDGADGKPMFVTFRGGVYDVSKFANAHPGGDFIKQAAGGDVEPFWQKWAYHYHSPKVKQVLKEIRVGTLIDDVDVEVGKAIDVKKYGLENLYEHDPKRTMEHCVLTEKPFCSETKLEALKTSYLTPNSALYIRNHAPVPLDLDFETHELVFSREIMIDDEDVVATVALKDMIKKHKQINITSVLQCAGNRAAEDIKATGKTGFVGTPFENIQSGEVGNISWTGVSLKNVLSEMYPKECEEEKNEKEKWHVIFEGADEYESSTPLSHILQAKTDCILATRMNGEMLPRDHGYPVRVLLPGIAGARSVKWLQCIKLSKHPSKSPWNSHYYRKNDGSHIQKLPLNSLILSPMKGDIPSLSEDGCLEIEGVAYSGGSGRKIKKVEISIDGGKSWTDCILLLKEIKKDDSTGFYGWVRFRTHIKVPKVIDSMRKVTFSTPITLICRATDENGVVQPETSKKQRGYLYNGWHKVDIKTISTSSNNSGK